MRSTSCTAPRVRGRARRSSTVGARSPSTASTSARIAASASGLRPSSRASQAAPAGGGVEAGGHQAADLVEQLGVGEGLALHAGQERGEDVGVGVGVDAGARRRAISSSTRASAARLLRCTLA